MIDHVQNRKTIIHALREEFVGPAPRGEEVDCSQPIQIESVNDLYKSSHADKKGLARKLSLGKAPRSDTPQAYFFHTICR